jgi:hypothetical protein
VKEKACGEKDQREYGERSNKILSPSSRSWLRQCAQRGAEGCREKLTGVSVSEISPYQRFICHGFLKCPDLETALRNNGSSKFNHLPRLDRLYIFRQVSGYFRIALRSLIYKPDGRSQGCISQNINFKIPIFCAHNQIASSIRNADNSKNICFLPFILPSASYCSPNGAILGRVMGRVLGTHKVLRNP